MGRIIFAKGKQKEFIEKLITEYGTDISKLANVCKVSERTIRDWRREKFSFSDQAMVCIQHYFHIKIPLDVKRKSNYWYLKKEARKGALRRLELYGSPGTPEGRKKGGQISQLRRKLHPELYPSCIKINDFKIPEKSEELAEFVGIILGDGGISTYQLRITLNTKEEKEYIEFVAHLMEQLFGKIPYRYSHKDEIISNITLGGIKLVELLNSLGLEKGNKVRRQAAVPNWIFENEEYTRACLRGLIDTDGGVFSHSHIVNGISCFNFGLCFGNRSIPLLDFVHKSLDSFGFTPKRKKYNIYLHREPEVRKYADIIGFHNTHHSQRLTSFILKKKGGVA